MSAVDSPSITISGTSARCTLGERCAVQLDGSELAPTSALLLRLPGEDCSNTTAVAVAAWVGLANPCPASPELNNTYVLGFPSAGPIGPDYVMCWTGDAGLGPAFDVGLFTAAVGDFTMHGPAVSAETFACYTGGPCIITLPGYGFEVGSVLELREDDDDCLQGGPLATFEGIANPSTSDESAFSTFPLGLPQLNGGALGVNFTLCWGATLDGAHDVFVGRIFFYGPDVNPSLFCILGEPCQVFLAGVGIYAEGAPSAVLITDGAGTCGLLSTGAVTWLGLTNPVEVTPVPGQPQGEVAVADFGLPLTGDVGDFYTFCWAPQAGGPPMEYRAQVDGFFELRGPAYGISVGCTLGLPCEVPVSGVGLAASSGVALVPSGGLCGNASTPLAVFFNDSNPASSPSPSPSYKVYDFGIDSASTPGSYRLCWAHSPPGSGLEHYRIQLGDLTLNGPFPADYACFLGGVCTVALSGLGLSTDDRLLAVAVDSECGDASASLLTAYAGLLSANPAPPEQNGAGAGRVYSVGAATHGVPGTARLCWAAGPGDDSDAARFRVEVGTLTIAGPFQGIQRGCRLCERCDIRVEGLGLAANDRIVMIDPSGTCGQALAMEAMRLFASGGAQALQNPPTVTGVVPEAVDYHLGTATVGTVGNYTMCWARSPAHLNDFQLTLGTFALSVRAGAAHAGTPWGGCASLGASNVSTSDTTASRTSALAAQYEATASNDGDFGTTWLSEAGACQERADRCTAGACDGADVSGCPVGPCASGQAIVFDLLASRLLCKIQVVNGVFGADASYGVHTLVVEMADSPGGLWAEQQTFSLPPTCPSAPALADLMLDEPARGRYVRLRGTESWGAPSLGLSEVVFWDSPWRHQRDSVDFQGRIPSPGVPFWAGAGGRAGGALVAVGGDGGAAGRAVLLLGGHDPRGQLFADVHRSPDGGVTWEVLLRSAPWAARRGLAAAATRACCKVLVLGGLSEGHHSTELALADAWLSEDAGLTWRRQSDLNDWRPRMEHAVAYDAADALYLAGGLTCSDVSRPCGVGASLGALDFLGGDVWRSADDGRNWEEVAPSAGMMRFPGRHGFSLLAEFLTPGVLYVVGGRGPHNAALADVWRSTDSGASWTPQALEAPFPGRAFHAAAMYPDDTAMCVLGGQDATGGALNDVWISTDMGLNWSQRAPFPGARFRFGAVFDASGELVVAGGRPFTPDVAAALCLA